jgi:hypothetical protein
MTRGAVVSIRCSRLLRVVLATAALSAVIAPAAASAQGRVSAGRFVAALSERPRIHLAVVTNGRLAIAYLCDAGTRAIWFGGRFRGRTAALRARRGRASVRLRAARRALVGTVRFGGRRVRFRALRVRRRAGLWRAGVLTANGDVIEAAWIVRSNGRQTGAATVDDSVQPAPNLNVAEPNVTLGDVNLTAVNLDPIDLFPFDVSPSTVTIDPSAPQRTGGETIRIIRDGIADVSGVTVRIGGLAASVGRRQPGSDQIPVGLPGGLGPGTYDVAVKLPGQAELVRRNVLQVVARR